MKPQPSYPFTRPVLLLAAALAFSGNVSFAGDVDTERHALTLEGARKVLAAAEAYARTNGAGGSIAIVDEGGHLLHFARLDDAFAASASVAIGKARTSALFKKPTKDFEEVINNGRFTMTALPDFTPLQGGIPILHDGRVVGAIGVSGARSAAQDEEVALAGAAAVQNSK